MITGVGFPELLVVFILLLLFFGSKELPRFIRTAGRLFAKARYYSDQMREELSNITEPVNESIHSVKESTRDVVRDTSHNDLAARKKTSRAYYSRRRAELSHDQRQAKSASICRHVAHTSFYRDARAIMVYMALADEVDLAALIVQMKADGKRTILPCCKEDRCELVIAEVADITCDCHTCTYGIQEPLDHLQGNFLKSDLDLVLCPGVAFDAQGGRLGRGKHYYDSFLEELKGRIPLLGVAFGCQISRSPLPRDPYTDITMDEVITEDGKIMGADSRASLPAG